MTRQLTFAARIGLILPFVAQALADSVIISDWQPWADLPATEKQWLAPSCPGSYVAPMLQLETPEQPRFLFDQAVITPGAEALFQGDVHAYAGSLSSVSEFIRYNPDTQQAELSGDVTVRLPDVGFSAPAGDVNLRQSSTALSLAEFVLYEPNLRGSADTLSRDGQQQLAASNIAFTRCAPGNNAWQIKASTLKVDTNEGVARAWNPRLEVKNIPVLYVPYISFPLNDQARTGFLMPTLGSSYRQPYYLHLAPNYDDTISADFSSANGILLSNEFRFLTSAHNGINQLDYRLLAGQNSSAGQRWAVDHRQSGQISAVSYDLTSRWVSDRNFDTEYYAQSGATLNQFNQLTLGYDTALLDNQLRLTYRQPVTDSIQLDDNYFRTLDTRLQSAAGAYQLSALWQWQQVDPDAQALVSAGDYELIRQPELIVNRQQSPLVAGFRLSPEVRYGVFSRGFDAAEQAALTGTDQALATDTQRSMLRASVDRPVAIGPLRLIPGTEIWHGIYRQQNALDSTLGHDSEQTLIRYSLDSQLALYQSANQQHALNSRLFYAYAPLQPQSAPLLDTSADNDFKLFTASRFSGYDRMGDLSRLSGQLAYQWQGNADRALQLSLDKGIKLAQERQTASGTDAVDADWSPEFSDWFTRAEYRPDTHWQFAASADLSHDAQQLNRYQFSADYQSSTRAFSHLAVERRVPDSSDATRHRIKAGAYFPLGSQLALIGYANAGAGVDDQYRFDELLAGIDIESCCWSLRLASLQIAADDDQGASLFPVSTERKYYFEVTLRGIGGGIGTIENLLNRLDFGYSGRQFNYR